MFLFGGEGRDLVVCVFVLEGEEFCGLGLLFFKEEFAVFL